jgi:hypothetical protein
MKPDNLGIYTGNQCNPDTPNRTNCSGFSSDLLIFGVYFEIDIMNNEKVYCCFSMKSTFYRNVFIFGKIN